MAKLTRAISIHAPHEGERRYIKDADGIRLLFQSTLPTRGSDTCAMPKIPIKLLISIHAPHEGERRPSKSYTSLHLLISIHAPHEGERPAPIATKPA